MLTVKQTATRLNVSCSTVYALIKSGDLVSYRIGVRRGAIRRGERVIESYLATCRGEVVPRPSLRRARAQLKHIRL
jgi:excisionase family DNA binding protein